MNEEMKSLKKTQYGKLLTCLKGRYLLDVGVSSSLNIKLIEPSNGSK